MWFPPTYRCTYIGVTTTTTVTTKVSLMDEDKQTDSNIPDYRYQLGMINATLSSIARDLKAVHGKQDKMSGEINALDNRIRDIVREMTKSDLDELNKRIAKLEQWRWLMAGAIGIVAFVAPIVVKAITAVVT